MPFSMLARLSSTNGAHRPFPHRTPRARWRRPVWPRRFGPLCLGGGRAQPAPKLRHASARARAHPAHAPIGAFADAPNPNRSPKRDCPDDFVEVDSDANVPRCPNKWIGVLTQLPQAGRIGVVGYPLTKEMEMEVPEQAAQAVAGETKTPFGYIDADDQIGLMPLINAAIALPDTEAEREAKSEAREAALKAHEAAMADYQKSPHSICHHATLQKCAADLAAVSAPFSQKTLTPTKVEVKIDPGLGILEVSASFKNTSDRCGEVAVNLGATKGLSYLSVTTTIADYPMEVECMRKEDARKSYKALNKTANQGAALAEAGRLTHGTRYKLPAGDECTTTWRLKVADPAAHWKPQPIAESDKAARALNAMEFAIFTPPGDGKAVVPFCIHLLRPDDDGITYGLAPSPAAEHEANLRMMPVYYVDPGKPGSGGPPAGGYTFDAPVQPLCLKVRVQQADEWDTLGDLQLDRLSIKTAPVVKVLSHARCGHAKVAGSNPHDCLAVVELVMPMALASPTRAVPARLNLAIVCDASGSMYVVAPRDSGMSNLQKLGKEVGAISKKLLGLVPYLRKNGLAIPGDQIIVHCIRFHCTARYVSSAVDLTGPNAEAEIGAMAKAFQDATDSGGTSYCSWLDKVEELAKEDGPLVVLLGTDGGAHDGGRFFPRLEALKEKKPKMAISVVAMGAWLDERCAARTQTDGHRLMQEVGPSFTDHGYQLVFKSVAKLLQGLSIACDGTVLAVKRHTEMPAILADGKTVHNLRLGTKVQYTVRGEYQQGANGLRIALPAFRLADGTLIEMQTAVGHLAENADAVLAGIDATYCAPSLAIVADAKVAHERAVTGLAFHYNRDTMYTACRTKYEYGEDKAKLPVDVKASVPTDVVAHGLLDTHRLISATDLPWMRNAGDPEPRPMFQVIRYDPPPRYRSLGGMGGEEPQFTSLGADDGNATTAFRSLGADDHSEEEPMTRGATRGATRGLAQPAKPSAKMDVLLEKVPGVGTYLRQTSTAYTNAIRTDGVCRVLQQLDVHEHYLLKRKSAASRDAPAFGADGMLTDDVLDRMADEQGAECDGRLADVVAELPGLAGALVHLAFLTHFDGGVHILNTPLADPADVSQVLLRVQYLRDLALRIAGLKVSAPPLYRPVLDFGGFVVEDGKKDITAFRATLKFERTLTLKAAQPAHHMDADHVVGTAEEAVQDVCNMFVKGWSTHTELECAHVPSPALIESATPLVGFDNELITIPPYQLQGPPPPCYSSGLSGLGCDPMEEAEPVPAAAKLDAAYFGKLADVVTKQVVALCVKKNP